jgi:hypothetical protein
LAGDSSSFTAGTRVDADGAVTAGFDAVGAGAGSVVATVAGVEHAANVNDASSRTEVDATEDNDFMTDLTDKGML